MSRSSYPSGTAGAITPGLDASAHRQDLPGDEAGIIAAEERDNGRLLLRRTGTTKRCLRDHARLECLVILVQPFGMLPGHPGLDVPWRDGIDVDVGGSELDRQDP